MVRSILKVHLGFFHFRLHFRVSFHSFCILHEPIIRSMHLSKRKFKMRKNQWKKWEKKSSDDDLHRLSRLLWFRLILWFAQMCVKCLRMSFRKGVSYFDHMLSALKRFRHQTRVNIGLGILHYLMAPFQNDIFPGLNIFYSLADVWSKTSMVTVPKTWHVHKRIGVVA